MSHVFATPPPVLPASLALLTAAGLLSAFHMLWSPPL